MKRPRWIAVVVVAVAATILTIVWSHANTTGDLTNIPFHDDE